MGRRAAEVTVHLTVDGDLKNMHKLLSIDFIGKVVDGLYYVHKSAVKMIEAQFPQFIRHADVLFSFLATLKKKCVADGSSEEHFRTKFVNCAFHYQDVHDECPAWSKCRQPDYTPKPELLLLPDEVPQFYTMLGKIVKEGHEYLGEATDSGIETVWKSHAANSDKRDYYHTTEPATSGSPAPPTDNW